MANYYWVGGTGTWDSTSTTNWASTSGGAGGAGVPTSADNAYFDDESDTGAAFTVTVGTGAVCKDLIIGDGVTVDALDQTMTLAGTATLTVHGSWFNPATNYVRTYAGKITFAATTTGNTITTNGVAITTLSGLAVDFNGDGGEWILQSSLSVPSTGSAIQRIKVTKGTLRTNDFSMISVFIDFSGSEVRAIYLGNSFLQTSRSEDNSFINGGSNLTFDAGTSTIRFGGNGTFAGGGLTYYNVEVIYSGPIASTIQAGISGANTFNNITIGNNAGSPNVFYNLAFFESQTILDTFSVQPTSTNVSLRFRILGNGHTITANAINIRHSDIYNLNAAGSASWTNGVDMVGAGDLLGNTGIDFVPKTVYWNLSGSQNWTAVAWATTPTGTPANANFPLAQDTAVITESGAAGTITINGTWAIGTLTFDDGSDPRTSGVTLTFTAAPTFYGDLKLSSGVVLSGTATATFAGRNTQNITSAGKLFLNNWVFNSPNGTVVLQDNTTTNGTFTLTEGTLNLNNKIFSAATATINGSSTRAITFGTGKIQISGSSGIVLSAYALTNFSYTGTGIFELTYNGANNRQINDNVAASGITESNAISVNVTGGTGIVYCGRTNNGIPHFFKNVDLTGYSGNLTLISNSNSSLVLYGNLTFGSNNNINARVTFAGTSGTQTVRSNGNSIAEASSKSSTSTLRLDDNLRILEGFTHSAGTVNLNGRVLTTPVYLTSNSTPRTLQFGAGQLALSGTGTVWDAATSTNLTLTPGTGKIVLSNNTNTARTFVGGGIQTYPELEIGGDTGTATTTITGENKFAKLSSTKQVAYTIVFPNGTTRTNNWNINGSSGQLVTLSRTGVSGVFTLDFTGAQYVVGRFLSISNSTAIPARRWYAINSTNGGSNTGWIFDAPRFAQFIPFFGLS